MPLTPDQFDPSRHPTKLNLGCGYDIRPGYLNVDLNAFHNPDLVADITDLGFLPSRHYEEIVAQDVLEHLPRTDTLLAMQRWNRLLRMGGTLVLRVPCIEGVADLLQRKENASIERQEELVQWLFGTQAYTGDFHFTSFTRILLEHYLREAGFEVQSVKLELGWLYDAVGRKVKHIEAPAGREFQALLAVPGHEEFVRACYREFLKRDPDAAGIAYWVNGMATGGMTREVVITAMTRSEEYKALKGRR
jgi:predicted SAM-dependent methyltransferase